MANFKRMCGKELSNDLLRIGVPLMKPYEFWDFCKVIDCGMLRAITDTKKRMSLRCQYCLVFKYHQYLRENGQISEAGSELAKVVQKAGRLQEENEKLKADNAAMIKKFEQLLSYDSLQWLHGYFEDIILANHLGDSLIIELEQLRAELETLREVQRAAEEIKEYAWPLCKPNDSFKCTQKYCTFQRLGVALAAVKTESNQTIWHDNGEFWECEECRYAFTLTGGTPTEHEISYCPKCGRKITV